MKYPKKLQVGDTIGLICPSSPISKEKELACKEVLFKLGYQVKMADNLTTNYAGYMAGEGKIRGQWINHMFADPEVDAIFCVRGGDGGSRAMEYVDFEILRQNPKIFVGYSDITSMHNGIANFCDFVTFHGPMVSSNIVDDFDKESIESLFQTINAEEPYMFKNAVGYEISVLKDGYAKGMLAGGNLSLLSASMGTPYEIDTKGKILFLEEVGEKISTIERFAYQLKNAGKFSQCKGIILGQFTECTNEKNPDYLEKELFIDILRDYNIPILYNIQSGHGLPNMTLPLGAICTMDTGNKTIMFAKPQREECIK